MTIQKYSGDRITCLSTDTKPTNVSVGAFLIETDTKKCFILTSSGWEETTQDLSNYVEFDENGDIDIGTNKFIGDGSELTNIGSPLTVKNVEEGSPSVTEVNTIEFDENTGLNVEDLGDGIAKISLGSHWKNLVVDGQTTLIPEGEETLEFIAGDGIVITTNDASDPQSITISSNVEGINGGVFITDIVPQSTGNVSNKIFSSDGNVLESCQTSTNLVNISVMAVTGNSNYIPVVKINDVTVTLTGDNTTPLFTGNLDVDLSGATEVTVIHEDGAEHTINISYENAPVILSATFIGDYPGSQTELKAGDTFSLRVQADSNFTQIQVYDFGACSQQTETFTATNDKTITVTIADRGTTLQELKGKIKIINSNGTSSGDYETDNSLNLNNLYPTVNITTITYPVSQGALKDSEEATIENGLSNYNSLVYSSSNSQLSIANTTTYESPKTVTRIDGDYNISNNNFTITATRSANGAVTASSVVVKIAHTSPTVNITLPQARLRSGGNDGTSAQNYVVTLTATQELLQAPTLDLGAEGTWVGAGFSGSGTVWTRSVQIHDDDTKGTYSFNNLSCYNLAGKEVTTIASGADYVLGGFVSRTITLNAFANETSMNVAAVTYTKVALTWNIKSLTNRRAVGTTTVPDVGSWCLDTLETNPTIIRILDTEATDSTSQASTITIQETV